MRITEGSAADGSQAEERVEGINADSLRADKAYDSDAIREPCQAHENTPVIPPKRTRQQARKYDPYSYRHRHWVEHAFLWLKRWRGMATCYARNSASFLAAVPNSLSGHLGQDFVTTASSKPRFP